MNFERLIDIGFGYFQGGGAVAILTGADLLGLALLAVATAIGIAETQRSKKANVAETPDEDPRGHDDA